MAVVTGEALAAVEHPPVLVYGWPNRWRPRTTVCAVLDDHAVRWVARDILEAAEGDPGDFADDPGHDPLVIAEHAHARTWTLDEVRMFVDRDLRGGALLHWLEQREVSMQVLGYGNVVRLATPRPPSDEDRIYPVHVAAEILDRDPSIATGQRRLFDWLLTHGWIVRRGDEYTPARSAIDAGLVAVVPRRKPHNRDPWPQVVLTRGGLTELHAALGGTNPDVLEQEVHPS